MNGNPLFSLLKWQPRNIKRQLKRRQAQLEEWHLILISVIGKARKNSRSRGSLWEGDPAIVRRRDIERERRCAGANRSHIRAAATKSEVKGVPNPVSGNKCTGVCTGVRLRRCRLYCSSKRGSYFFRATGVVAGLSSSKQVEDLGLQLLQSERGYNSPVPPPLIPERRD